MWVFVDILSSYNIRDHLKGKTQDGVSGQVFFAFLKLFLFCFVVAIFDLVYDVEAIHDLC